MNKTTISIVAIVLIIIAFYGGSLYGKSQANAAATAARAQFAGRTGAGGFGGRGGAGGATAGSILSNSNNQLTIQLAAGGSEIVFLTSSTTISKTSTVTPTDLTTGQNVMIAGTKNSDGSVTATLIQVRPTAAQ